MPYIVVVNRPGYLPEQDPYAVATLDEARDTAAEEVLRSYEQDESEESFHGHYGPFNALAHALTEQGGTIGPLPDGYVIDVQAVTWDRLSHIAESDTDDHDAIIDSYNES